MSDPSAPSDDNRTPPGMFERAFGQFRKASIIAVLASVAGSLLMFVIFYIYAAMGSIFFAGINEGLWGNITISMLTLSPGTTL